LALPLPEVTSVSEPMASGEHEFVVVAEVLHGALGDAWRVSGRLVRLAVTQQCKEQCTDGHGGQARELSSVASNDRGDKGHRHCIGQGVGAKVYTSHLDNNANIAKIPFKQSHSVQW